MLACPSDPYKYYLLKVSVVTSRFVVCLLKYDLSPRRCPKISNFLWWYLIQIKIRLAVELRWETDKRTSNGWKIRSPRTSTRLNYVQLARSMQVDSDFDPRQMQPFISIFFRLTSGMFEDMRRDRLWSGDLFKFSVRCRVPIYMRFLN